MSNSLYLTQTLLLAVVLFILCRTSHWILRVQVVVWAVGVTALFLRFGQVEQLNFYSNDQRYYASVVSIFLDGAWTADIDWWIDGAKLPYTIPATLLALAGFEPGLSLKTIAVVGILLLTRDVLKNSSTTQPWRHSGTARDIAAVFLSACGVIGMFYSTLALRETMMMLIATRFVLTKSPAARLWLIVLLYLLRPHLAVSLGVAALFVAVWKALRKARAETVTTLAVLQLSGTMLGNALFFFALRQLSGNEFQVESNLNINSMTRVMSNYVGLQFLAAPAETTALPIANLILLRLLLLETIVIPTLFIWLTFTRPHYVTSRHLSTVLGFSIYIGLATNTDFNSFRQNIPFMALMGIMIMNGRPSSCHRVDYPAPRATAPV